MRIVAGLEGDIHLPAVLPDKSEHILVDKSEAVPSEGNHFQGIIGYLDIIELDKLDDLHEGISDLVTFADLADQLDHLIRQGIFEVYHVRHYLLEVVTVVVCLLIFKQFFVKHIV